MNHTAPIPGHPPSAGPLLRTLAPSLGLLEQGLRTWLDAPHRYPLSTLMRGTLEGLASDLKRQAQALDVDRPLLVIMLMGGTGVGKSTLLNALAGGAIAEASLMRPTTRDPVVYHHQSIRPERLDPALARCRLIAHDRPALEHKIIVDTPDLDSNDLANRDKLSQVLPVADVVLYVGSQEKYHDQLGWELFLQQRRRRAFAFVLNKWDRCTRPTESGLRPDEDLLRDLQAQGFESPLLFRTCAQAWLDASLNGQGNPGANAAGLAVPPLPDGEQFPELVRWLELGLTRLEIEAIKARGVSQLLQHLQESLAAACPPDLTEVAGRTRAAWESITAEEARTSPEVLLDALEPYQREIEHHFALEGQRRFRGPMAVYLRLFTRAKYVGSTLRERIPFLPRSTQAEPASSWDLAALTRASSSAAAERHLDSRGKALANRLLVEADRQGFAVDLLTAPTEEAGRRDWRQRYALSLGEVLREVEQAWTRPRGMQGWVQTLVVFLADWAPPLALLGAAAMVLWRFFDPMGRGYQSQWSDILLPFIILLMVLIVLHLVIVLLLPIRWPAIRGEFQRKLERRLQGDLRTAYADIPEKVADQVRAERKQVERLQKDTSELAAWLGQREEAASIAGLYGQ